MSLADDNALVVFLAAGSAGCSLNESPGKNWVENNGGLPDYICRIAKAVMKSGKSRSSAIAIAVSRTKKWAAGGDKVDADTRAKAAKAVAEWEALKAKSHAGKVIKATNPQGEQYIMLSEIGSFNTECVRAAWNARERAVRIAARQELTEKQGPAYSDAIVSDAVPYTYVRELWTDYIIVQSDMGPDTEMYKVPYTVTGDDEVTFGDSVEVKQEYVEVPNGDDLTEEETTLLGDLLTMSADASALARIMALSQKK